MRWGRRKVRDDSSSTSPAKASVKPKKLSRKEVRAEKDKFYQDKANRIITEASQDPKVLVRITTSPGSIPQIATGREVLEHLRAGGYMDIKTTDIYARQDKKAGGYVVNEKMNERFVRSDKKKKP